MQVTPVSCVANSWDFICCLNRNFFYYSVKRDINTQWGVMYTSLISAESNSTLYYVIMQVTPVLGIVCALLIICILKEPPRGQSEGVNVKGMSGFRAYYDDVIYCIKIPSYVLITLGTAMGTFTLGGLAQWASLFLFKTSRDIGHAYTNTETNLLIGVVLVIGGLGGIVFSSELAKRLRTKIGASADCYVCAFGLYVGSALIYTALTVASYSLAAAFVSDLYTCTNINRETVLKVLTGFAVFFFSLFWAPVTAILLVSYHCHGYI